MSCRPVTGLSQIWENLGKVGKSGKIWENKRHSGKENDNVGKWERSGKNGKSGKSGKSGKCGIAHLTQWITGREHGHGCEADARRLERVPLAAAPSSLPDRPESTTCICAPEEPRSASVTCHTKMKCTAYLSRPPTASNLSTDGGRVSQG